MRRGFQEGIIELGHDPNFVLLTGDHGYALFDEFRSTFHDRFINVGVAEANLVGVASGLARAGFRPLIYGLASFLPSRVYEFLKLQIALDSLPVTVVGDGGGLVYSTLGHSHQSLDDLALANALPNFQVFSPSSDQETLEILRGTVSKNSPTYLRLGKSDGQYSGSFPTKDLEPYKISTGSEQKMAIVCHGSMTSKVMNLKTRNLIPDWDVWSAPKLSPMSSSWLKELQNYTEILVVEEHIAHGGLSSLLQNALSKSKTRVSSVSAKSSFHSGIGSYEWALAQNGLDDASILEQIKLASPNL